MLDADQTVLGIMRGYLRTSRSGGMPRKLSDKIEAAVADAARLNYFSVVAATQTIYVMLSRTQCECSIGNAWDTDYTRLDQHRRTLEKENGCAYYIIAVTRAPASQPAPADVPQSPGP